MTITVSTNTLSTNARYVVYSGSTAATDAKELLLAIEAAVVDLGWSRYDTAGAAAVLGTDSSAGIILRKQSDDFASSGHYNYLGMHLAGSTTYRLRFRYAADYSDAGDVTASVNKTHSGWAPYNEDTGSYVDPSFSAGGTIWIFAEDNSIVFKFTGTGFTEGTVRTTYYFGNYKKTFGEACDPSTGYIHNGVMIDPWQFVNGTGMDEYSLKTDRVDYYYSPPYLISQGGGNSSYGYRGTQFALTEWPVAGSNRDGTTGYTLFQRGKSNYGVPVGFTDATAQNVGCHTRIHMGWLGWIGDTDHTICRSLASQFMVGNNSGPGGASMFMNATRGDFPGFNNTVAQYLPNPSGANDTGNSIALYEPVLSTGAFNGPAVTSSNSAPNRIAGYTNYVANGNIPTVFAINGKPYGFRMSIGQPPVASGGYAFLDTANIPIDAEGFFDESGVTTAMWAIPVHNNSNQASACIWVKK